MVRGQGLAGCRCCREVQLAASLWLLKAVFGVGVGFGVGVKVGVGFGFRFVFVFGLGLGFGLDTPALALAELALELGSFAGSSAFRGTSVPAMGLSWLFGVAKGSSTRGPAEDSAPGTGVCAGDSSLLSSYSRRSSTAFSSSAALALASSEEAGREARSFFSESLLSSLLSLLLDSEDSQMAVSWEGWPRLAYRYESCRGGGSSSNFLKAVWASLMSKKLTIRILKVTIAPTPSRCGWCSRTPELQTWPAAVRGLGAVRVLRD